MENEGNSSRVTLEPTDHGLTCVRVGPSRRLALFVRSLAFAYFIFSYSTLADASLLFLHY